MPARSRVAISVWNLTALCHTLLFPSHGLTARGSRTVKPRQSQCRHARTATRTNEQRNIGFSESPKVCFLGYTGARHWMHSAARWIHETVAILSQSPSRLSARQLLFSDTDNVANAIGKQE